MALCGWLGVEPPKKKKKKKTEMNTSKLTRTARGTENFVNHGERTSKAENASGSLSTPTLSMELQRMSSFGHNY